MRAEVISIGDELTSGQRLDTNSQWLSQQLAELGVRVLYHTTVGDDLEANVGVFRQAFERVELVIATGGLGPTADDLTREALARAAGTDLVMEPEALEHIRSLFARRKREMPERNRVQAMFPRGSRMVPNPQGTAPGIDMDIARAGAPAARVFALPGVPAEMCEMWQQTVAPAIVALLGDRRRVIRTRTIRCFGIGESDLEAMLPDLIRRGRQPTVGITVSKATISLRIAAEGISEEQCQQQIDLTSSTIRQCLGQLVFGEGEDELAHAVMRLAAAGNLTLATAEGGSGGLMSEWLSEADGCAGRYVGGVVRRRASCSTAEATAAWADEVRRSFGADWGLALSDFPTAGATPGDIYIAHSSRGGVATVAYPFVGHPEILTPRAVKQALNFLRLSLLAELPIER
jgi:nicotinamide-nucleotide amidase